MKKLIHFFLVLLFFVLPSFANAGILSRDYLGGAVYCEDILSTHPQGWGAGFFATEFGDAMPCVKKMIQLGLSKHFRIQLVWRASHVYDSKAQDEADREAARWEQLAVENPGVLIILSGACEHRLGRDSATKLRDRIQRRAPHTRYSNSYIAGGSAISGSYNEVHGGFPGKPSGQYIISTDGTNIFDIDMDKWQKTYCNDVNNFMCFGHTPRDNGRQQGTVLPPKKRPRSAFPNTTYLKAANRVMQPKGAAPRFAYKVSDLKYPNLWKTDSEDKVGNTDSRANKPVALLPLKWTGQVALKDSNGRVVCKLKRFSPDYCEKKKVNGRETCVPVATRHYSGGGGCGLYGVDIANAAKSQSGNEFVAACNGSSCLGPINAAFRGNYYRP